MSDDKRGLYGKFFVFKVADLSDQQADALAEHDPPPLDEFVFVLRYDRDPAARRALHEYACAIESENPKLADELRWRLARTPRHDEAGRG